MLTPDLVSVKQFTYQATTGRMGRVPFALKIE